MKSEKDFDISIVTVGMNHLQYLKELFPSIYRTGNHICSYEVIYVDNCSTDGSINYINANFPQVKIIANNNPLGFGENNNKGAKEASGKYIAIINPDIVLKEDALQQLFLYSEKSATDAVIAPKLLNPDLTTQHSVRSFMTLSIFLNRLITKGNDQTENSTVKNYLCKTMDYSKTQTIDWAIGAALFMPALVYKKLGGFDEDYFLYVEDEDFCLRAWQSGFPVIYFPKSEMIHNHLRASSKLGKKALMHLRSRFTFFIKHGISVKREKNDLHAEAYV